MEDWAGLDKWQCDQYKGTKVRVLGFISHGTREGRTVASVTTDPAKLKRETAFLKKILLQIGANCDFEPNIFLMSLVLFSGTFTIAYTLKNFRNTGYLPGSIRDFLSDFAVIIAILTGTAVSFFSGTHTPRLVVPVISNLNI